MGKRQVRVVLVRKWVSAILLALTTIAMTLSVVALADRAYVKENRSTGDLLERVVEGGESGELSSNGALALLMPVVANALVFVPWGFLTFVVLDRPSHSRLVTHVRTVAAGMAFALVLVFWQSRLPERVVSVSDVLAYAAGTFAGAILANLRKGVRIRFDF